MSTRIVPLSTVTLFLALALSASPCSAQLTRTWVSSKGDDANQCSLIDPCATFKGALAKTAPGGYIGVLDAGGFGHVTIDKSITIDGGSATIASVLETTAIASGIFVSAGPFDVVTIRNLSIVGGGKGLNGILAFKVGQLHVENCVISDFTEWGISFEPSANLDANLFVENTVITHNGYSNNALSATGGGIRIRPSAAAWSRAFLNQVRVESNLEGVMIDGTHEAQGYFVNMLAQDSVARGNSRNGFTANGTFITMVLDRITAVGNGAAGVEASGLTAGIVVSNSTVTLNGGAGINEKNLGSVAVTEGNHVHSNAGTNIFLEKAL
jgi:parallel beta helix pectate lyase-like protein